MTVHNNIEKYISLTPRYYHFLKSVTFSRTFDKDHCSSYDVELVLSKLSGDSHEDLRLVFVNAFDINIGRIEGMLGLLVDIEDVSDRQIERGRYLVTEQEELAFSFYCEEFFADIAG